MKTPGLKVRKNANGSSTGYWVASNCSRNAKNYPDQVRRLVGDSSTWAEQCQEYTADLKAWLAVNKQPALRAKGAMSSIENRMLHGKKSNAGFIYILRDVDRVKIGFSTAPRNRVAAIQNMSGRQLRVIACVPGTQTQEQQLHQRFSEFRLHGEWFRVDGELKEFLKQPAISLKKVIG